MFSCLRSMGAHQKVVVPSLLVVGDESGSEEQHGRYRVELQHARACHVEQLTVSGAVHSRVAYTWADKTWSDQCCMGRLADMVITSWTRCHTMRQ